MSFSKFAKNFKSNNTQNSSERNDNDKSNFYQENTENFKSNKDKDEEKLREKYDSLKDKSEDELMRELFSEVTKQKENGSFDFASLKQSVDALSPFLNQEQLKNIQNLLQKIK